MDEESKPRPLFGESINIQLPERFVDISDFRPIPDSQEVFADANVDQSLIVDIMEQPNVPDEQAIEFHFEDQCREGDTNAFKVDSVRRLADAEVPLLHMQGISQVPSCWLLAGQITASKGMENALNKVQVLMCLVRIPDKATDVLLTLNTPIFIAAESAAAKTAGSGHQSAYVDAPRLFSRIIASFCILNWDLFD